jgi:general secretion pathway protein E/type IV pilus assembly protein PilB
MKTAQILNLRTSAAPARLGERLLRANLITGDQLDIALHEQERNGNLLGATLIQLGFLDERKLAPILAEQAGFPTVDLKTATGAVDLDLIEKLPRAVALRCHLLPLRRHLNRLDVAIADPYDIVALDEARRYFPGDDLQPFVAPESDIRDAIERHYGAAGTLGAILREIESGTAAPSNDRWEHPIVRLADTILQDAVRSEASDIHLEPETGFVRLRIRVDGMLRTVRDLHRAHWPELSHRLKIMAGMNIAETRSMQDGRFRMTVAGADIDFRMAIMPTVHGENIVIRVLNHQHALRPLEQLGFSDHALAQFERVLKRPEGIFLVTGPTGSGKTTTLYALINKISHPGINVMTLEEPVEYQINLVRQTSVQERQGLGFAEGVRGILRQDPDVILIGEMRDEETAQMAMRAAMTGHRVFSTLHCNSALGAIQRLGDLGVNLRIMAENITGIIAQRLVRRLCLHCRQPRHATADECGIMQISSAALIAEPQGCAHCSGTGYRGRVAVAEVLSISRVMQGLIITGASRNELAVQAAQENFVPMPQDGIGKVLAHETSLDELTRVVDLSAEAG